MSAEDKRDKVSLLIGRCLHDSKEAERIFKSVAGSGGRGTTSDEIHLSEAEKAEFVARFSAEIGPVLWESKRRKDPI